MKKFTIFTILMLGLFVNNAYLQTCNTSSCSVVGEPYINDCIAGIERYLARSISMDGLTLANDQNNNWPSACQNSNYTCNQPYTSCPLGGYCPQRYCDDIQVLTDLKIAFVRRAAGLWGSEAKMKVGNSYYNAAQQTIIDINKAYDCAGLRRPIIQAAILEYISSEVNQISIPQYVKSAFSNDSDYNSQLYSGTINFNSCRIAMAGCVGTPDLNKIEARMWFYYLATNYIDFGYKALHMGNIKIMIVNDSGNSKTYTLFQRIRNYAENNNSFVVIDAHTNSDLYLNSSNTLLLDFNSAPIRPIETYSNPLGGSCNNDYKTQIIANQGDIYNKSNGGVSPMGCDYSETPYFVEFDHHEPYCGTIGQIHSGSWCVWGYDEVNYFYNLSDGCKLDFVEYAYPKVRDIDYHGFLQMPGRHGTGSWNIPNDKSLYRLHDYSNLKNGINSILAPSLNIGISYNVTNEYVYSGPYLIIFRNYNFTATNSDNSSVLTWHMKKPNGSWEDYTYGNDRVYRPLQSGIHTIYLRQDNLGLPTSMYGSKTISINVNVPNPPYQIIPLFLIQNTGNGKFEKNVELTNKEFVENLNLDYILSDKSDLDNDFGILFQNDLSFKEIPIIYPNPTSNILYLDMKDFSNDIARASLIDMLGRTILVKNIKANNRIVSFELDGINSGVYNLLLRQNEYVHNYRVVIER